MFQFASAGPIVNLAAGTQTATSGTVILSNSNGISFAMAGSATITASADYVRSISAGTTNATGNQIVLSNSNGISFSANGATITATADYVRSISAGTTNATGNQIVFSNSNGVSFSANGATVTATADYVRSISAGTTNATGNQVVFSNSNGISFGANGATVTANAIPVLSFWAALDPGGTGITSVGTTHSTMLVYPLHPGAPENFPGNMTVSTLLMDLNGAASQTTAAGTIRLTLGLYTQQATNSLSLLNSVGTSITYGAVSNNTTAFSGQRFLTIHSSQWSAQPVLSQTQYWMAMIWHSSGQTQGFSINGVSMGNSSGRVGTMHVAGAATNSALQWWPFLGRYTAGTTNLPAGINRTDIAGGGSAGINFVPRMIFDNHHTAF